MAEVQIGPVRLLREGADESLPLLSILVPSVRNRADILPLLQENLRNQAAAYPGKVEFLYAIDNKEISIGSKRQLLEHARGKWIAFFDDDDLPFPNYLAAILQAIAAEPDIDCIGFPIEMTTNGKNPKISCHSLRYRTWESNVDGYDYVRTINHLNPVLRQRALLAGFKDIRYGEDLDYAMRLRQYLRKERFIKKPVLRYQFCTEEDNKEKFRM